MTQNKEKEFKLLLGEIRDWLGLQRELGRKRFYYPASHVLKSSSALSDQRSASRSFNELREIVLKCVKCPLSKGRTSVVFGSGNEKARLMFVGEAPGFDEDRQGEPFVGKAGQLLTKMIQAMGLERKGVYITNIVKCRPPNNRTPRPEEIEECWPYLLEQIEKIQPKVICALGNVAAQTLLRTAVTISKLRGLFHEFHGTKVMPTFHPAFLLRNPEYKREVWRDLKLIMDELGLPS